MNTKAVIPNTLLSRTKHNYMEKYVNTVEIEIEYISFNVIEARIQSRHYRYYRNPITQRIAVNFIRHTLSNYDIIYAQIQKYYKGHYKKKDRDQLQSFINIVKTRVDAKIYEMWPQITTFPQEMKINQLFREK